MRYLRPTAVQLYGVHVNCVKQVGYGLTVKPQEMPTALFQVMQPMPIHLGCNDEKTF